MFTCPGFSDETCRGGRLWRTRPQAPRHAGAGWTSQWIGPAWGFACVLGGGSQAPRSRLRSRRGAGPMRHWAQRVLCRCCYMALRRRSLGEGDSQQERPVFRARSSGTGRVLDCKPFHVGGQAVPAVGNLMCVLCSDLVCGRLGRSSNTRSTTCIGEGSEGRSPKISVPSAFNCLHIAGWRITDRALTLAAPCRFEVRSDGLRGRFGAPVGSRGSSATCRRHLSWHTSCGHMGRHRSALGRSPRFSSSPFRPRGPQGRLRHLDRPASQRPCSDALEAEWVVTQAIARSLGDVPRVTSRKACRRARGARIPQRLAGSRSEERLAGGLLGHAWVCRPSCRAFLSGRAGFPPSVAGLFPDQAAGPARLISSPPHGLDAATPPHSTKAGSEGLPTEALDAADDRQAFGRLQRASLCVVRRGVISFCVVLF